MSYCTNCGAANHAQAAYCAACGSRLQGLSSARRNTTNASGLIGGILAIAIAVSLIGSVALVSIHLDPTFNFGSSGDTTSTPATLQQAPTTSQSDNTSNSVLSNSGATPTQPSSNGSMGPIAEGDFLYSPGPVTGPAIVEFWNGQGGANDVCGTFQLPSGESFNYKAGHWWKYKSDQDMQADWPLHLALYNQKAETAPCTRGQRPPA